MTKWWEKKTTEQRFFEKIDIKEENECWNWLASLDIDGYGNFSVKKKGEKKKKYCAHRYSYMHFYPKENIDGLLIRHTCDKPSCVNPKHLIPGSPADNSRDMTERNRQAVGERNGAAKLSDEQAKKILKEYKEEKEKGNGYGLHIRLGNKYGVDKQIINRLISGKTFKHLQSL